MKAKCGKNSCNPLLPHLTKHCIFAPPSYPRSRAEWYCESSSALQRNFAIWLSSIARCRRAISAAWRYCWRVDPGSFQCSKACDNPCERRPYQQRAEHRISVLHPELVLIGCSRATAHSTRTPPSPGRGAWPRFARWPESTIPVSRTYSNPDSHIDQTRWRHLYRRFEF